VVAVPSERLERVDVYHIGANGYTAGPWATYRFSGQRVDKLLDAWLNYQKLGGIDFYTCPGAITLEVPHVSGNGVTYRPIELQRKPRGVIPFIKINKANREVVARWPPASVNYRTVSPDAESEKLFGPFDVVNDAGTPTAVSRQNGTKKVYS
jgi:hypothetical protein